MLIEVALCRGDAVRLGVLDLRCRSALAISKELRECMTDDGDRGLIREGIGGGRTEVEKDMERSEVGVDSSIAGG